MTFPKRGDADASSYRLNKETQEGHMAFSVEVCCDSTKTSLFFRGALLHLAELGD